MAIYNGIDYTSLGFGLCLGIIAYGAFDIVRTMISRSQKEYQTALNETGRKELDFVYEKTGFKAHKVGNQPFNGFIKIADNPEAEKVEEILYRYSNNGFVFTDRTGRLFGRVCTICKKADRVDARRSMIKLVINNKREENNIHL